MPMVRLSAGGNKAQWIADQLRREIESGLYPVGASFRSVRELSRRFDVSLRTVHLALGLLEDRGYIARRHGSGTRVLKTDRPFSVADSAVLCIEARGHVFGELAARLARGLRTLGMFPIMADISATDGQDPRRVIQQAASGGSPFFLAHVHAHFPVSELKVPVFRNRTLIGILDWASSEMVDRVYRVIVDHVRGGEQAARFLFEKGHRHVLVAGTEMQLRDLTGDPLVPAGVGRAFASSWRQFGGQLHTIRAWVPADGEPHVDFGHMESLLRMPSPPTALFGLMDAAAWACRAALFQKGEGWMNRLDVLGYGNTLWSQTAHPPFSSLDWRIETIVSETLGIIERIRRGETEPVRRIAIEPQLVFRNGQTRSKEK